MTRTKSDLMKKRSTLYFVTTNCFYLYTPEF